MHSQNYLYFCVISDSWAVMTMYIRVCSGAQSLSQTLERSSAIFTHKFVTGLWRETGLSQTRILSLLFVIHLFRLRMLVLL